MTGLQNKISVTVNGQKIETSAKSLDAFLVEQGYSDVRVATALNHEFVAERARAETHLTNGDAIEVVTARQGG